MTKLIIGLSAIIGDTIYWGNRNTGEVDEIIIDHICISKLDDDLTYEYYDIGDAYICNEEDLQRNKLLGTDIFCTHEALRNLYMTKEKIGD